jgi:rRNA maturation endonuclease Nob1
MCQNRGMATQTTALCFWSGRPTTITEWTTACEHCRKNFSDETRNDDPLLPRFCNYCGRPTALVGTRFLHDMPDLYARDGQ